MDHVVSELCDKGTILKRNYRKMTICKRIIDTCYGLMPMVFSKNKSLSIVPFFTVKLP